MLTIDSIENGTKFTTTAVLNNGKQGTFFNRFGAFREKAYIFACDPEEIVDVECEIVDNDLIIKDILSDKNYDKNCIDYFACIRPNNDGTFEFEFAGPNIKVFYASFPYGPDIERFWQNDVSIPSSGIEHKKGDRKIYFSRIKVNPIQK